MRGTTWVLAGLFAAHGACSDDPTAEADTTADITSDTAADTVSDTTPEEVAPDTAPDTVPPDTAPEEVTPEVADTAEEVTEEVDQPAELAIAKGDRCDALMPFDAPALPFSDDGDTSGAGDDYIYTTGAACGGPAGQGIWGDASADLVYAFTPPLTATYRIELTPSGDFDPGVMVTDACPPIGEDGFAALTCQGFSDQGAGATEVLQLELRSGRTYYLLVDGWSNDTPVSGAFALSVRIGEDCDDGLDNDANDATDCADPQCSADPRCDEAGYEGGCANGSDDDRDGAIDCSDDDCDRDLACDEASVGDCDNGLDDEGDGRSDCADPDCDSADNCDEAVYPEGCDNTLDDDGDGKTDCDDADCGRAAACLAVGETCESAPELELDLPVQGTTLGRAGDYGSDGASCALSTGGSDSFGFGAPDAAFRFTPQASGKYLFETVGDFDDAITVTSDCSGAPTPVCFGVEKMGAGGERLVVDLAAGQAVFVIVDGWSNSSDANAGDFTLKVSRATAADAELDCADGLDDDGDGDADCADSDCAFDRGHCVENGNCDDLLDNDGDDAVDCDDLDCRSDVVACPPPAADTCATPGTIDGLDATVTVDTCDFGSDFMIAPDAGCVVPTFDSPDAVFGFTAPAAGLYLVDVRSDSFASIVDVVVGPSCPGLAVTACVGSSDAVDAQKVSLALDAGEQAWIIVSGYGDEWFEEPGCGPVDVTVYEVDPEVCDDELDNDRDDQADCADDDCGLAPNCNEAQSGPGACDDGLDNDRDQLADCFDIDCAGSLECPDGIPGDTCASPLEASGELWSETVDTCNYQGDFVAEELGGCQSSSTPAPKDVVVRFVAPVAGDYHVSFDPGADDGVSFDALLNVVAGATCPTSPLTSCVGGSDQGDPESATFTAGAGEVFWIVAGGWSSGCGLAALTVNLSAPEVCDDGVDNDGDGDEDCADQACAEFAACLEVCDDDLDNDVDFATDCDDDDCAADAACNEAANGSDACRDGEDDDADRLVDCYDADCALNDACPDGAIGDSCAGAPEISEAAWSQALGTCGYKNDFEQFSNTTCTTMGSAGDAIVHFVAPQDGDYQVSFTTEADETFDSVIDVVAGDACPTAITACAARADNGASSTPAEVTTFAAVSGESFWIIVDGYSAGCGIGVLELVRLDDEVCDDGFDNDGDQAIDCQDSDCRVGEPELCPVPAGELCGGAIVIDALPFLDETRTSCDFAKDYDGDDETCWDYGGAEVVYAYTAAAAVTLEVSLESADSFDVVLSAVEACPVADLLSGCSVSADDEISLGETIQLTVASGETIYFFASTYGSSCGDYRFEVLVRP